MAKTFYEGVEMIHFGGNGGLRTFGGGVTIFFYNCHEVPSYQSGIVNSLILVFSNFPGTEK